MTTPLTTEIYAAMSGAAFSTSAGTTVTTGATTGTYQPAGGVGVTPSSVEPELSTPTEIEDDRRANNIASWLGSAEAQQYEGRWVSLDEQLNVLSVADAPSELGAQSGGTVVFVFPAGVAIVG